MCWTDRAGGRRSERHRDERRPHEGIKMQMHQQRMKVERLVTYRRTLNGTPFGEKLGKKKVEYAADRRYGTGKHRTVKKGARKACPERDPRLWIPRNGRCIAY